MRQSIRRRVTPVLVAAAAASALSGPPARASTDCGDTEVQSYDLEVSSDRSRYEVGETAVVRVQVNHTSDRAAQGSALEKDIDVLVAAEVGDVLLAGGGTTNDQGVARVRLRIKRHTPAGKADVRAYANESRAEAPCLRVTERGSKSVSRLFRVIR